MRFADLDGTIIDVYQANTNMTDESRQSYPATVDALLDNAVGPLGYYGAFGTNIHTDFTAPQPGDEAIVASAQARGVPLISYKQLLDWTDGRNASTIRGLNWSAGTFTFVTTVGAGRERPPDDAPDAGPDGHAERDHLRRIAACLHGADDQGHPVRDVRHDHRHLSGDLLLTFLPYTVRQTARTTRLASTFAWRGAVRAERSYEHA